MGRLGTFLGLQKHGIDADLVSLAKALGGGLPLGAVLLRQKVADQLKAGDHGTTFGGNPVACAVGLAVVNQIAKPEFLANVEARSAQLKAGLEAIAAKFPAVKGVRGEGLILGLALDESLPVGNVIAAARDEGMMVLSAKGNVLRLLPPLNVSHKISKASYHRVTAITLPKSSIIDAFASMLRLGYRKMQAFSATLALRIIRT